MSEMENRMVERLACIIPKMSEREKGYLDGVIATAAAMSQIREEKEKADQER